jgi:enoyl-CoA hydratase
MSDLLLETDGPVLTITMNRPDRRNAVDGPMAAELKQAFESFEADDDLEVAVLTGAGGSFCAGADLTAVDDPQVGQQDSVFGVFCRRWGVPLIDGGTVRLPRIVGMGRALDLILTGRPVGAHEALQMGLANR